jgi:hypothetical protein
VTDVEERLSSQDMEVPFTGAFSKRYPGNMKSVFERFVINSSNFDSDMNQIDITR